MLSLKVLKNSLRHPIVSFPIKQYCISSQDEPEIPSENLYEAHTLAGDAKHVAGRHSKFYDVNIIHLVGTVSQVKILPRINLPDYNWADFRVITNVPLYPEQKDDSVIVKQSHRVIAFVPGVVKFAERMKPGCRVMVTGHLGYYKPSQKHGQDTPYRKHGFISAHNLSLLGYMEQSEIDWKIVSPHNDKENVINEPDPNAIQGWHKKVQDQTKDESDQGLSYSELMDNKDDKH